MDTKHKTELKVTPRNTTANLLKTSDKYKTLKAAGGVNPQVIYRNIKVRVTGITGQKHTINRLVSSVKGIVLS